MPDAPIRTMREAARCAERFRQDSQLCDRLCEFAFFGLCRSSLRHLSGETSLRIEGKDPLVNTPETVRDLDLGKRLLEQWIEDDACYRSFHALGRSSAPSTVG
jgi:hypothetical protein